jgi:hypothetical protein
MNFFTLDHCFNNQKSFVSIIKILQNHSDFLKYSNTEKEHLENEKIDHKSNDQEKKLIETKMIRIIAETTLD